MDKRFAGFSLTYNIVLSLIAITLPINIIKINSAFMLLLPAIWLIERGFVSKFRETVRDPLFITSTIYIFICLFSVLYSAEVRDGFSSLETRVSLFLFPMILFSASKHRNLNFDLILIVFLISCVLVSFICIADTVYQNQILGIDYSYQNSWRYSADNLTEKWGFHPSYFSVYCAFCIFIIIHFVQKKKLMVWIAILLIIYLILFQTLLASRVGIFSVVIIFIVTLLYEAYVRRKLLVGLSISAIILIGSASFLYSFGTMKDKINAMVGYNVNQYNKDFGFNVRIEEWRSSLAVFSENFWAGVGIGDRKNELAKVYEQNGFTQGFKNRYDSHNLFLDTAVSIGFIGLLSLIPIFWVSGASAIKIRSVLYVQFLLLFLLISMVEASFSVQKGVVFFAFMNTLFYNNSYFTKKNSSKIINE